MCQDPPGTVRNGNNQVPPISRSTASETLVVGPAMGVLILMGILTLSFESHWPRRQSLLGILSLENSCIDHITGSPYTRVLQLRHY